MLRVSGVVFTTHPFPHNLRLGPISLYYMLERLAKDEHTNILGPCISYEENEVL
jgi:hypothetical protein